MGGDTARLIVALLGPVEIGPADEAQTPVPQPRLRVLLGLPCFRSWQETSEPFSGLARPRRCPCEVRH